MKQSTMHTMQTNKIKMNDKYSITDHCKVSTGSRDDSFVGLSCRDGILEFVFPMGYGTPPKDDKLLRTEILKVFKSISLLRKDRHFKSTVPTEDSVIETDNYPIISYLYMIRYYLENGYYKQKESHYTVDRRGKINWGKTIKTQKPYISNGNIVYLDYIVKKETINENELISLLHKYCVFESFERIGWLFTDAMPEKSRIRLNDNNKAFYLNVINNKLDQTFNDEVRKLLVHMRYIIEGKKSPKTKPKTFTYGTTRFEYVWEKAVDIAFGFSEGESYQLEKQDFFPKTFWNIGGKESENSYLRPDSIMIYKNDVYILDAKYYKYGIVRDIKDLPKPAERYLPQSADINKQITYGEYITSKEELKEYFGNKYNVYNAFVMPFHSNESSYENIGSAYSPWKQNNKDYEQVQGILVDLRHLIDLAISHDQSEIDVLAQSILKGLKTN